MRLPAIPPIRTPAILFPVGLGGCSLLRDLSADQCQLDSDCRAQPQFAGDALARGMGRLLSGLPFGVGSSDIPKALSALQSRRYDDATKNLTGTFPCLSGF